MFTLKKWENDILQKHLRQWEQYVTYMEDRRGPQRTKRMKKGVGPTLQYKSITEQTHYYKQLRTGQEKIKSR